MPMSNRSKIEDWILDYGIHAPEDKRRVEAFVSANPEWEDCLREARRWEVLLNDSRKLADSRMDDLQLPDALASRRLPPVESRNPLRRMLSGILKRSGASGGARVRRSLHAERRYERDSDSHVARHFESLTGHVVREPGVPEVRNLSGSLSGKNRRRIRTAPRPVRMAAGTVGAAVVVYLVLFVASVTHYAPAEKLARLTEADFTWTRFGVTTRGEDAMWQQLMADRYNAALDLAASSRKSFLGLFPGYRADRLLTARNAVRETIAIQLQREPAPAHAYLVLAKLNFLLGDTLQSLEALKQVVERDRLGVQEFEAIGDY